MYRALQPRARRTARPASTRRRVQAPPAQAAQAAQNRQPATARREVSAEDRDWWRYANMGGAVLDCYQGW